MLTYHFALDDSNHREDVIIAIACESLDLAVARMHQLFTPRMWPNVDDFVLVATVDRQGVKTDVR